jgi:hypothetical protein
MSSRENIKGATLAIAFVASLVGGAVPLRAAPAEVPNRILISIYGSESAANVVLGALKAASDRGELNLEARSLVVKGTDGRTRSHDKRAPGSRAGQTVAALSGLMGARGGVGVGASPTLASDYLTSNVVAMPRNMVDQLKTTLRPGEAAIISAVDAQGAEAAARLQSEGATRVLTHDLPGYLPMPSGRTVPSTPFPVPHVPPGTP